MRFFFHHTKYTCILTLEDNFPIMFMQCEKNHVQTLMTVGLRGYCFNVNKVIFTHSAMLNPLTLNIENLSRTLQKLCKNS